MNARPPDREAWLKAMERHVFARAAMRGITPIATSAGIRYGPHSVVVDPPDDASPSAIRLFVRREGAGFTPAERFEFTMDDDPMDAGEQIGDWMMMHR